MKPHFSNLTFEITNLQELTVRNFLRLAEINLLLFANTKLVYLNLKFDRMAEVTTLNLTQLNKLKTLSLRSSDYSNKTLEFELSEQ